LPNLLLNRLNPESIRKHFNCGDDDLDDFFYNDSKGHAKQLLTVTYALESEDETIAYFSVLNDNIRENDTTRNKFRKISKEIPRQKRYKSHPAVKIGRFAVSRDYQGKGHGTMLMDYIKGFFIKKNKTGCRFITVDAYKAAIKFYQKNGFDFLTTEDKDDNRRQMYFDLYPLSKVIGID
jgi:GNAT superfamily N-acetyltransferase